MRRLLRILTAAAVGSSFLAPAILHADDDPAPLVRAARYRVQRTLDPARSGPVEARLGGDGHLWVKPRVNGKDIGWFMLDTGKTGMSIDPDVARKLGLDPIGETELYGVGGTAKGELFRLASFDLGPFHAVDLDVENMPPMLMPTSSSLEERPVGVVGSYVLRDLVSVLDLANSRVSLFAPAAYRGSEVEWVPTRMRPDVPAVEVKVTGKSTWLLLDTGMPGAISLFHPDDAAKLKLAPVVGGPKIMAMGSDGRALDLRMMTAATVEFAGETRKDVRITVPAEPMAPARPALQGLLGSKMLAGRTIVIDGPRRRVGILKI
jgi:predicted aspartyl protease